MVFWPSDGFLGNVVLGRFLEGPSGGRFGPFWALIWASGAFRKRREIRSSHSWPPGGLPEGFLQQKRPPRGLKKRRVLAQPDGHLPTNCGMPWGFCSEGAKNPYFSKAPRPPLPSRAMFSKYSAGGQLVRLERPQPGEASPTSGTYLPLPREPAF